MPQAFLTRAIWRVISAIRLVPHPERFVTHDDRNKARRIYESQQDRCRSAWQGELKYGPARFVHLCPQPAPMSIDDGSADGQPHPRSAGLRGVKRLENSLEMFQINTRPRIAHSYQDPGLGLFGPDQQFSWPRLDR